jgi:hypothetical protein
MSLYIDLEADGEDRWRMIIGTITSEICIQFVLVTRKFCKKKINFVVLINRNFCPKEAPEKKNLALNDAMLFLISTNVCQ